MSALIPNGTTETASSDFTVSPGDPGFTFFLTNAVGGSLSPFARAEVQIKSAAGLYFTVLKLTGDSPMKSLRDSGTFRVVRRASDSAFGVDAN